jgi:MSHA biogenesis protein MshL
MIVAALASIFIDEGLFAENRAVMGSSSFILDNPNLSRKVSLALNDTNIVDALIYLSEKAEINVAVSKSVEGRATLSLTNVSIRDALDIILLANELACEKRGEILYVMPAADYESLHGEKWSETRQVQIFKLRYAKPADVLAVLDTMKSGVGNVVADNDSGTVVVMETPEKIRQMKETVETMDHEMLTKVFDLQYVNAKDVETSLAPRIDAKGLGTVKADEKYNRVIVNTLPGKMEEVEKVVRQLDSKIKQVLIEAKIMSVKLTPAFEMGVDWQRLISREPIQVDSTFPIDPTIGSFGRVIVGKYGGLDINATIDILKTIGETKLISSPRISALNNEEAKIFVGTKEFYTQTTTTISNGTPTTAVTVNFIDVGVELKVTPIINDDGFILMKIRPEVSRVDRTIEISTGDDIPVIDTTNAETRVMVQDGNTIIIGGLIKDETSRDTQKFPVLGDIPIFGSLFKHVREDKEKSEMVVFLTPHIIGGDKDMTQFDTKQLKSLKGYDENA